jgi:hypothetical protein
VYSCSSLLFLSFGADFFVFVAYFVGAIELRQAGGSSAHDLTVDGDSCLAAYESGLFVPSDWARFLDSFAARSFFGPALS